MRINVNGRRSFVTFTRCIEVPSYNTRTKYSLWFRDRNKYINYAVTIVDLYAYTDRSNLVIFIHIYKQIYCKRKNKAGSTSHVGNSILSYILKLKAVIYHVFRCNDFLIWARCNIHNYCHYQLSKNVQWLSQLQSIIQR